MAAQNHDTAAADPQPAASQPSPEAGQGRAVAEPPRFERAELAQFAEEDRSAGRAIGKMLALFFLYTVIVMSLSGIWTYYAVSH